jgi:hypothetical protein
MPELLSQIQNLFPSISTFPFVFFVVVVGLIALMFVLVILKILWSIFRLIFGGRSSSLYYGSGNSAWRSSMGNRTNPNSLNNPSSWTNINNMNSPNNPNGWTNMNSPNNPNGWMHPASPNNPRNRMNTPTHRPMHKR